MRKTLMTTMIGIALTAAPLYGGNGSLVVDGALLVGTTTDSGLGRLQVNGNISAGGSGSWWQGFRSNASSGSWGFNQSDMMAIGVGSDVYNRGFSQNAMGIFNVSPSQAEDIFLYNQNSPIAGFLVLKASGNVGIGTAAPAQKLDVAGTVASNGVALTSDAKFKKNLLPVITPLEKVLGLNGHSYEWKTDEYKEKNFPEGRHYGVIAQEVEKVLPEVVNTDAKGEKSVAYTEIIPVLIEAIKEQQKIIESQQKEIQEIKSLIGK